MISLLTLNAATLTVPAPFGFLTGNSSSAAAPVNVSVFRHVVVDEPDTPGLLRLGPPEEKFFAIGPAGISSSSAPYADIVYDMHAASGTRQHFGLDDFVCPDLDFLHLGPAATLEPRGLDAHHGACDR